MGVKPEAGLSMWVVYERPRDWPNHYVARRHDVYEGRSVATEVTVAAATLDEVRELLPPHLTCLPRYPNDEPHIIEVWL